MTSVLHVDRLSKQYRLGVLGHGMLFRDVQSWWARVQGKEDPNSLVGSGAENQQKANGTIWALRDLSLEVKQGEVLGIIGKNGAGKSTFLKILSKVTAPTRGVIKIRGRVASLLEVGTGFHPELTGRENIFLNGAIMGMSVKEIFKKFDEIVSFAGVEPFIDTPVKRYSSGMYVRLAFAVAAHLEPDILLVDEVLAVGDAEFQRKCLGKMSEVAKEGRTVLVVSHQMHLIARLCHRGLLLENGRAVGLGPTAQILERYLKTAAPPASEIVDLTTRPRSGPVSGGIRLLAAHFVTGLPIAYGSRVEIKVDFQVLKPLEYAEIGLVIISQEETYVSSVASGDAGGPVLKHPIPGKVYSVSVRIPEWRWTPRAYRLSAGIRSGPTIAEDRVDIETFDVIGDPNDPSCLEKRWDYYRPRVEFEYAAT